MVSSEHKYSYYANIHRAGGNCPAAPVLAEPVFLKVKMKFNFYKKQVINKVLVWFLDLLGLLY